MPTIDSPPGRYQSAHVEPSVALPTQAVRPAECSKTWAANTPVGSPQLRSGDGYPDPVTSIEIAQSIETRLQELRGELVRLQLAHKSLVAKPKLDLRAFALASHKNSPKAMEKLS